MEGKVSKEERKESSLFFRVQDSGGIIHIEAQ